MKAPRPPWCGGICPEPGYPTLARSILVATFAWIWRQCRHCLPELCPIRSVIHPSQGAAICRGWTASAKRAKLEECRMVLHVTVVKSPSTNPKPTPAQRPTGGTTAPAWSGCRRWLYDTTVTQLRDWVTGVVYRLPEPPVAELEIGRSRDAGLQLGDPSDPTGGVSRRHARLTRVGRQWRIDDLHSKNGVKVSNARVTGVLLEPGMEICIGNHTLIAENPTLADLHAYLARLLGWDAETGSTVNLGIRALRAATLDRKPVHLVGDEDLLAVARQIHRRMRGAQAPFVLCASDAREEDAIFRITAMHPDPGRALELAAGGTVCIRAGSHLGVEALLKALADPRAQAQVIICAKRASKPARNPLQEPSSDSIEVPNLSARSEVDRHRIVVESAVDSISELGAELTNFTARDREWVAAHATSFSEIEGATLRLVARSHAGNVSRAAPLLGISHVALRSWFRRWNL